MTIRAVYRVVPGEGGWKVEGRGFMSSRVHDLRGDAIEEAIELARYDVPSHLEVCDEGGRIVSERVYDVHPGSVGRTPGATLDPTLPSAPSWLGRNW